MKTKSRRFLSLFLAAVMAISVLPFGIMPAFAETSDDFVYEIISEEEMTCKITGYTGYASELIIPSQLDGYTVASIGYAAFYHSPALASITIPNSVTSIGQSAFGACESLVSITIPDSVTNIGEGAFEDCTSMENFYVSPDNENYCDIDGVLFNKDVTTLVCCPGGKSGDYEIPDSVTSIDAVAFYRCSSLTSIIIPDGVMNIDRSAFCKCTSLESVTMSNGVKSIGDSAFEDCISLTSIEIPDGVTRIEDSTFEGCTSLTSVIIPDSVNEIGWFAFKDCTSLTDIIIPDSVAIMDAYVFDGCISLTDIIIPDSVTSIGASAFYECASLTSIEIPNSVTKIDRGTFSGCTALTSIIIPDSVTIIGAEVFHNCEALTIYGYSGSYAETYANNNSIPFVALAEPSILQYSKAQIRFRGIGAASTSADYKGTFDVRTVAKISQEDFINTFESEENALEHITDIGFVYAATSKVADFDIATAKAVAEGDNADNYVKKSVNYIQHTGDGADYIFTCLISNIPDADKTDGVTCLGFICYGGKYYYFDTASMVSYNELYTAYMPA